MFDLDALQKNKNKTALFFPSPEAGFLSPFACMVNVLTTTRAQVNEE